MREEVIDKYFYTQPPRDFVEDLKEHEIRRIFKREAPKEGEIPLNACHLRFDGFLQVKSSKFFADFERFLDVNRLKGTAYPIVIEQDEGLPAQDYRIEVTPRETVVFGGGYQAIIAALVRIEDELLANGGYLQLEGYIGKNQLKNRITRCFFSPTNRPPKNGDELFDDIDYYPEEYLERLAYNGVNGIWIYSDFNSLLTSSYITEYGKDSEKRVEKLNAVIDKCAKYGIDVYLFAMEPMSMTNNSISAKLPNLIDKYPQIRGNRVEGEIAFCSRSSFGKKYLKEAIARLIKSVPKLKGLISITQGERVTACSTTWRNIENVWHNHCKRCKKYSRAQNLGYTISLIQKYITENNPDFQYISWTYEHRLWGSEDIGEYLENVSAETALMQNFEDNGRVVQLGKIRQPNDYWLSYVGPSPLYVQTANFAKKHNRAMWAKMQICCSHEVATVPYIPAPGIVYDKITRAKRLGIDGVMESWYFGNYPSVMSKAVGVLSYGMDFSNKREFLRYLAGLYYKREHTERVVEAWLSFERGYKNYPVNTMFSYYGPMHDGVVWDLQLLPKNNSLPRSWQLVDIPDGDRIGECLFNGHTLDEAITLVGKIGREWKRGVRLLQDVAREDSSADGQNAIAETLSVLFNSGKNVLRFYKLRNDLGYGRGESKKLLSQMKRIVKKEIANSKRMVTLCERDNRVGYHSEAEGFKFFPQKLLDRVEKLERLLSIDFACVEDRIEQGKAPLAYYLGEEEGVKKYSLSSGRFEKLNDGVSSFKIRQTDSEIIIELKSKKRRDFILCNEFELMFPQATVIIKAEGEMKLHRDNYMLQSYFDEKIEAETSKWQVENLAKTKRTTHVVVRLRKSQVGFIRFPYKMLVNTTQGEKWCQEKNPVNTLGKSCLSPGEFGWITD